MIKKFLNIIACFVCRPITHADPCSQLKAPAVGTKAWTTRYVCISYLKKDGTRMRNGKNGIVLLGYIGSWQSCECSFDT